MRLASVPALLLVALTAGPAGAADTPKIRPAEWAQPVVGSVLGNFCQVSPDLYRSEQPGSSAIPDLKTIGVRTLLNLRHYHNDSERFAQYGLVMLHYPMDAGSASIPDLIKVLRAFRTAQKPVLIHCWHGSDRTGFIVAGYRIVFMNWTPGQAVEELRLGGFGYHQTTFPDIARTLESMDVVAVKQAVLGPAAE